MIEGTKYEVLNGVPFSMWDGPDGVKLFLCNTMHEWRCLHSMLMHEPMIACDTETTGLRWYKEGVHIIGMSFGWGLHHFYVPVRHVASRTSPNVLPQLEMEDLTEDLRSFFSRRDMSLLWANAKFDWHFYENEGVPAHKAVYHDVLTSWKFYDENSPGSLKSIATGWKDQMNRYVKGVVGSSANMFEKEVRDWRVNECAFIRQSYRDRLREITLELEKRPEYQGVKKVALRGIAAQDPSLSVSDKNKKLEDIHYGFVPIDIMARYAAMDTYLTWKVHAFVMKNVKFDAKRTKLYITEHRLTPVLFEAERQGTFIDLDNLKSVQPIFEEQIRIKNDLLVELLPDGYKNINVNSTAQLGPALIAAGVPLTKRQAKTNNLIVDKKALSKVASYPLVEALLDYRKSVKITDTYIVGLQDFVSNNGRVHGSFNQNMRTGRMSMSNPSLLNIPKKDTTIRNAFIIDDDYYFVIPDFSQIEVRLLAHESKDPLLLDTYAKGQDVHTRTMCEVFGYDINEVTGILLDENHPKFREVDLLRSATKTIVFGIIYGISALGLAEQIKRPDKYLHYSPEDWLSVCEEYIRAYFDKYLYVKRFINSVKRQVKADGYVTNAYGRVRHLPYANAVKITGDYSLKKLESRAERQAVNFLIQGMAADMFKEVVIRAHNTLKGTKSHLVNLIHDEIWFYIHKSEVEIVHELKRNMEDFNLLVPIIAEFSYSTTSWAQKLKGFPPIAC